MNLSFVRIKVYIKLYTGSYFISFLLCRWAQGIVIHINLYRLVL